MCENTNNKYSSNSAPLSKEISQVIVAELLVLVTNIDKDNFNNSFKKIHYLLDNSSQEVYLKYLRRLINLISSDIKINNFDLKNSIIFKLINQELNYLTLEKPQLIQFFKLSLITPDKEVLKFFNIQNFLNFFKLTVFQKIFLSLSSLELIENNNIEFLIDLLPELIEYLQSNFLEKNCILIFLKKFLNKNKIYTILQKLITLGIIVEKNQLDLNQILKKSQDIKDPIYIEINNFFQTVNKMSFKDILQQLGPHNLAPDKLLTSLLNIQQQDKLDDSISILLTEILFPTSQLLDGNRYTSLTPENIVESTANGTLLNTIFYNRLTLKPNWDVVIDKIVSQFLQNSFKLTTSSLSQFLSCLLSPQIDFFLKKLINEKKLTTLQKQLIIALHELKKMAPDGAIHVLTLDLEPVINDQPNVRDSILYFLNIAKLELITISNLQHQDQEVGDELSKLFDEDYRAVPEYLVIASISLLSDKKQNNEEEDEIILNILNSLFTQLLDINSTYLPYIVQKFHEYNNETLAQALISYHNSRSNFDSLQKSLSLAIPFEGGIEMILNGLGNFEEILVLSVEAANLGWPNLEVYLNKKFQNTEDEGANQKMAEILKFIESKCQQAIEIHNKNLKLTTVHSILNVISNQKLSAQNLEIFKNIQVQLLQVFPRLINFGFGHDEAILAADELNPHFSPEVEEKMKLYFQRMYSNELEIRTITDLLRNLKNSDNPQEQDLFACMLHSIIDEYRFFPEYPIEAIALTSVLFGSMIHFKLFEGTALQIALRYILDSARQPAESNMFKFAVQALYACRQRLPEFKNYCSILVEIPTLQTQPQVYNVITAIVNGELTPNTASAAGAYQQQHTTSQSPKEDKAKVEQSKLKSIFLSNAIKGDVPQETPDEEISDKVLFIVNNISTDNFDSKIEEMREILLDKYCEWFAFYLVVQRAKSEPNYHEIYGRLVKELHSKLFENHVLFISTQQIIKLMNVSLSNSGDQESLTDTERQNLKNLGSWLGRITISRNRPILHQNFSFNDLLVEAFDHKKLSIIIPFVCKVLDQAKYSKVFAYPNPWLLGILAILKELYEIGDLKLNLKFEIEVLCNSLNIKLDDIEASGIIRSHEPHDIDNLYESTNVIRGMAKMTLNEPEVSNMAPSATINPAMLQQQQQQLLQQQRLAQIQQQQQQQSGFAAGITSAGSVTSTASPLNMNNAQLDNSSLGPFAALHGQTSFVTHPNLKRIFQMAFARSVREILPAVVERVNGIALFTTKSLVTKDFALDGDELKLRLAAQQQVSKLAEKLTIVTCHDLLKEKVHNSLVQLLGTIVSQIDQALLDELNLAIDENIDIAIAIIQNSAVERALQDLEEILQKGYQARRQHKESRGAQPFIDISAASKYAIQLPEPLGLKLGGVTPQQLSVYENFAKQRTAQPSINLAEQQPAQQQVNSNSQLTPNTINAMPVIQQQQLSTVQQQAQLMEQSLISLSQLLDLLLRQSTAGSNAKSLKEIPNDHQIKVIISQISTIVERYATNDQFLLKVSQAIINILFTSCDDNQLAAEIFVELLAKICSLSPITFKDVSYWLVHVYDERKLNENVMIHLLKRSLVSPVELDSTMSKLIADRNQSAIVFSVKLLTLVIASDSQITVRSQFIGVIEALRHELSIQENSIISSFFERLNEASMNPSFNSAEAMCSVYSEWVKICQRQDVKNIRLIRASFVKQLFENNILSDNESLTLFFRLATQVSVTSFIKDNDSKKQGADFYATTDAFADLIMEILINVEDDKNGSYKLTLLKAILSIVTICFAHDHEDVQGFNQRPYFRIYSTLLANWKEYKKNHKDGDLLNFDKFFYLTMAETFTSLQPLAFPGFTFSWIALISNRFFLPCILELSNNEGWSKFVPLLTALLRFQSTYVNNKDSKDMLGLVYKGTVRIFLLILHDFPEFLVQNHYQLIINIQMSHVQLRNIVLSAFPSNMTIADPFQAGLKVDRLPEINEVPVIAYDPAIDLANKNLRKTVDNYLRVPSHSILKTIVSSLKLAEPVSESGIGFSKCTYDLKTINALVFYVGISAVNERQQTSSALFNQKSSHVSLLSGLIYESGSVELQYQILEAITNQLRYPNAHTHWFSCILIYFFSYASLWGSNRENIQELIARVLLERTIANRPHPWGLLITFTELLKNSEYAFFELGFTKSKPEFETLFGSLLRHISSSSGGVNPVAA
ncbi:hypothetical protein PACTADRAFT_58766 [Pachysolen tannophilus NRRL Y-2460]|uniref:General negative regulator of transcription subunit 1 n=1 Tax=Pachysolen tannophilus NRRL Y-2460 TaxID=669874 RepID=A0A1E4TVE7_PACTA|nr:hypothetical protein PACTADRAFT_58766 [Pachysolen tannophilus NRRL Y-2460]